MKNLFLIGVATFALAFTSCSNDNESSYNYPDAMALVTARNISETELAEDGKYFFELDNKKTLYVVENSISKSYDTKDGERSVIYLDFVKEEMEGYDYTVELRNIFKVIMGEFATIDTKEQDEEIANNTLSYVSTDITLACGYLNLIAGYVSDEVDDVKFILVENNFEEAEETKTDYLNLELRFDRGSNESIAPKYENYVSFDMSNYEEALEGKKGIILKLKTVKSGSIYVTIDETFPGEEEKTSIYTAKTTRQY